MTRPTLSAARPFRRATQRGVSMLGLLFWALLIGFVGYLAVIALPTINEYLTIQRAINKIASEGPTSVGEIRKAFERQKDIEYSISSITEKDLVITKENDRIVISFAYDKVLPIFDPVYLLIKYQGRTK
ncbi:MAG: DUF4845 domain-containing protein [Rubrivivax sp.]